MRLSRQDIDDIARTVQTEVDHSLARRAPNEYSRQIKGVVDTITNRVASPSFPNSVRDVVNQNRQFSKIAGPPSINPFGSVQKAPKASAAIQQAVESHIADRVAGKKSVVGSHVNYANPHYSSPRNLGWINGLKEQTGIAIGAGTSVHYHGTVPGMKPAPEYSIEAPSLASRLSQVAAVPTPTHRPASFAQPSVATASPTTIGPQPTSAQRTALADMGTSNPFSGFSFASMAGLPSAAPSQASPSYGPGAGAQPTSSQRGALAGLVGADYSAPSAPARPANPGTSFAVSPTGNVSLPSAINDRPAPVSTHPGTYGVMAETARAAGIQSLGAPPSSTTPSVSVAAPAPSTGKVDTASAYGQMARSMSSAGVPSLAGSVKPADQRADEAMSKFGFDPFSHAPVPGVGAATPPPVFTPELAPPVAVAKVTPPTITPMPHLAQVMTPIKAVVPAPVRSMLSRTFTPSGVSAMRPGDISSIARANISNPRAHSLPGGGTSYSGKSANFPGYQSITNEHGITTISKGLLSSIDNTPADKAKGPGGGNAGGEGTVLCTHYHAKGWLPDDVYASDAAYGLTVSPEVRAGYHRWAVPLVRTLKCNPVLEWLLYWPVSVWAHSMHRPDTLWSKALRWIGEGTCKRLAPKTTATA